MHLKLLDNNKKMFKKSLLILLPLALLFSFIIVKADSTSTKWSIPKDEKYVEEIMQLNTQMEEASKKIKNQEIAISEIEKITHWEWSYAELSDLEKQEIINSFYDVIEDNGWDTNWWIWSDNLTEVKESIEEQKQELSWLQTKMNSYWEDVVLDIKNKDAITEYFSENIKAENNVINKAGELGIETETKTIKEIQDEIVSKVENLNGKIEDNEKNIKKIELINKALTNQQNNLNNNIWDLADELAQAYDEWNISKINELQGEIDKETEKIVALQKNIETNNDSVEKFNENNEVLETEKDTYDDALDASSNLDKTSDNLSAAKESAEQWNEVVTLSKIKEIQNEQKTTEEQKVINKIVEACSSWNQTACNNAANNYNDNEVISDIVTACSWWESDACDTAVESYNDSENQKKQEAKDAADALQEQNNPGLKRIKKWDDSIITALLGISDDDNIIEINKDGEGWLTTLGWLANWIKDTLNSLIMFISVAVFLFIWAKLAMARWNPEEFKKAMLHFVYAVVWIFIISIAWATVVLVSWINL